MSAEQGSLQQWQSKYFACRQRNFGLALILQMTYFGNYFSRHMLVNINPKILFSRYCVPSTLHGNIGNFV